MTRIGLGSIIGDLRHLPSELIRRILKEAGIRHIIDRLTRSYKSFVYQLALHPSKENVKYLVIDRERVGRIEQILRD